MTTTKKRLNENDNSQNLKRRRPCDDSRQVIERINSSAIGGQTLRAVSLRADGTFVEVLLPLSKRLSKNATVLGNWDFIEVILVVLEDQDDEEISFNTHILLPPFQNTKFRGDIMLIKRDVEGSPVDYSITSYKNCLRLESTELLYEFHNAKFTGETMRKISFFVKLIYYFISAQPPPFIKKIYSINRG